MGTGQVEMQCEKCQEINVKLDLQLMDANI